MANRDDSRQNPSRARLTPISRGDYSFRVALLRFPGKSARQFLFFPVAKSLHASLRPNCILRPLLPSPQLGIRRNLLLVDHRPVQAQDESLQTQFSALPPLVI